MSKKRKKKVRLIKVEVRIPVEKELEILESPEEPRERPGEICGECKKKRDTKKVGDEFLCLDCREEMRDNHG